ncbi:MAG: BON domain-containing protein [Pseudomonadota bacterium]|nr:BON domain-containing protein [Pseudomonadota bacterium]
MQSLLIAFIIVLSHGVVLAETTKTPSSETMRDTTPGSSAPNAEKQGAGGAEEGRARDAENTGVNVRDRGDVTVTPEEQGGEAGDRELTAAIRRAIVKDDSLSLNAHNVKIITRDGIVTLRGPVENTAERTTIAQLAEKTAGVKRVDNQLEINAD